MTDIEKVTRLRNDDRYFGEVYNDHRPYAMRFMSKIHKDHDVIQDVYQDAVIVLLENVKKPDFQLSCSIQTYLNSICRNQLLTRHRKDSKNELLNADDFDANMVDWFKDLEFNAEKEDRISAIEAALEKMKDTGKQCFDLLHMQYFMHYSMEKIAGLLNFSGDKSAKSQAAKCRAKLREIVSQSYAKN